MPMSRYRVKLTIKLQLLHFDYAFRVNKVAIRFSSLLGIALLIMDKIMIKYANTRLGKDITILGKHRILFLNHCIHGILNNE